MRPGGSGPITSESRSIISESRTSIADGQASRADDLDLLRAYEPVVRFTKGELFLPTAVGPYVKRCSLWAGAGGGKSTMIIPDGG